MAFLGERVKVNEFLVIINKADYRTMSHSPAIYTSTSLYILINNFTN